MAGNLVIQQLAHILKKYYEARLSWFINIESHNNLQKWYHILQFAKSMNTDHHQYWLYVLITKVLHS